MSNIVNMSDYRQEEKQPQKKKTKRRLKKKWRIIFSVLILIIASYAFLHSSLFTLENVVVEGNQEVVTKKVLELSEITLGGNLFELDKMQIKSKLEDYPFIKEADFSYQFPDTFVIEVVENKTLGFIVTEEGYVQFSQDGMVLAIASNMGNYNMPVVTGIDLKELPSPGGIIQNKNFSQIIHILSCADEKLLHTIAEINMTDEHIIAYTYQGMEIKIGFAEGVESRLHDLNDILTQISAQNIDINTIEYVDIRYKDVPTIKFKE